ncbi:uncharacterized protein N7515_005899 [Penicillium bovifimosum]|uniref:HD domain-containing protein n=1 Tax=Penicillium bovifimosum TaxID=126998 RepID=A0A9W9L0L3_9EURO|nr:uncharacterized protein N7515_005899 [Penicillium bovifimosum]KAJ5129860.1 hypothetical protein N7515_005899 [Penicillium bovifimosum]
MHLKIAVPQAKEPLASVEEHTRATVRTLFQLLESQGQSKYLGEQVTQLEHSLQCAHLATQSPTHGDDLEVILAALFHDIGRFIPDGQYIGRQSHEILGETFLREIGFSEKVCKLVGQDQVREAQHDPLLEAKLAVRRCVELAKEPGCEVPPLEAYEELAYQCLIKSRSKFTLHSKTYNLPTQPTVVICIDGFDPDYLKSGIEKGLLPTFRKFLVHGFHATAKSCMPSFTNPNNVSIITGAPPSAHGIAGNFFLDRKTGEAKMITDDSLLRGSTLLEQMSRRGVRVAAITAKDKLRRILAHGLKGAICFSSEKAADCTLEENGISDVEQWLGRPAPSQYSSDLSLFVLDAGIKLLEEKRSDILYLTLSDYIQHKHEPGSPEADSFLSAIDECLQRLATLAPVIGVTGDHGMSNKSNEAGEPNVIFLEDVLNAEFGPNASRVICPITDPFVRHHGALGSFVRVYLKDISQLQSVISFCESLPDVELALSGPVAAQRYEMPLDREADIVVISKPHAVIGSSKANHDLSGLRGHPLRSHGGLSEQDIPVIMSKRVNDGSKAKAKRWRNYDIFDLVLNWSA